MFTITWLGGISDVCPFNEIHYHEPQFKGFFILTILQEGSIAFIRKKGATIKEEL